MLCYLQEPLSSLLTILWVAIMPHGTPARMLPILLIVFLSSLQWACGQSGQTRPAATEAELRAWLENMVWYHGFEMSELQQVTGLSQTEVAAKLQEFGISADTKPPRTPGSSLVLPYPGGRHPRIGFLDGAIDPQRETKLSVFCPWDETSYAVLDVPEAVWSNLGLTYLAHTHIDTVWTKQGIELEKKEWTVSADGNIELVRRLPNGIELGVKVIPQKDHLRMKMWLTNGTTQPLSDLRVQNCVMLKGMDGFNQQTNENKLFENGYAMAHSADRERWIISAWDPVQRTWGNAPCPCLHSDPQFPDCPPGETKWLRGWFSFYQGKDIASELARIEATGWRTHPLHHVTGNLVGKVVDADTGKLLPCRLYVQNVADKQFHFARSTAVAGSAVVYDRQLGKSASVERHTTLSADGFQADVSPGRYRIRAELGKEYLPVEEIVDVASERTELTLRLKRFSDISQHGWYSGDTHVHRAAEEMPNVMLAEDLNVAFPLSYWVRDSSEVPSANGVRVAPEPVAIDARHVYYPLNTEYEIFSISGRRHTQGAVFVLNHQQPLRLTAPPVRKIAAAAREQGALLDLDKHSWNWSAMIVPIMGVDLFELSNNHHWRTQFGFPKWTLENAPPAWPEIETDAVGFTERGWTDFGFQTYYAFLNCGFRMRVTAGTASGVHPVPLGYGRVYVHCGDEFSFQSWMENLNRGHSFVSQGPLLDLRFSNELPGTTWTSRPSGDGVRVTGTIYSARPLESIQAIRNGEALEIAFESLPAPSDSGAYVTKVDSPVTLPSSGWLALRCFEQSPADAPPGKVVFAHTNPVFVDIDEAPLAPRRRDVEYFIQRIDSELERNAGILSDEALAEFAEARQIYQRILQRAR